MAESTTRAALECSLDRIIDRFSGRIGFYARNLTTGEEIARDADTPYPTASVIKLAVLAEILRLSAAHELALDRRILMTAEDIVAGSGVLKEMMPGLEPTVRDLASLMIVVSDNTATNMLIDLAGGVDAVNHLTRDVLGLAGVTLYNRIDFDRIEGEARKLAEGTPRDLAGLVAALVDPATFGAEAADEAVRILRRQQFLDQVPRYLEVTSYSKELGLDESLWVASKTGFMPGTWVDAGMIRLPDDQRIVYCAATNGSTDESMSSEAEGAVANGLLGRLLVEYWWSSNTGVPPLRGSAYLV